MTPDHQCPKCGSKNIYLERYLGTDCLVCETCDYDQRDDLDATPEEKSGKGKESYTPYKTGGAARTRK